MARIAGIDLPKNKRGVIGLTYIYGIGRSRASEILTTNGIDENTKVEDWSDDQVGMIRNTINEIKVEGALRSEVQLNIKRLISDVTEVFVTELVCRFVVKERKTTLEREKVEEKLLQIRKKQLNNS